MDQVTAMTVQLGSRSGGLVKPQISTRGVYLTSTACSHWMMIPTPMMTAYRPSRCASLSGRGVVSARFFNSLFLLLL